jgi:hypothetical protein
MNVIELWKILISGVAVFVSLIGVAWGIRKDFHLRAGRLREEFKFALELKAEIQGLKIDPLIKERGLHALVGSADIPAPVVEYLISLRDPQRALRLYRGARKRLVFLAHAGSARIVYKGFLRYPRARASLKVISWLGYGIFYVLAASPLLLKAFKLLDGSAAIQLGTLTVLMFFPVAVLVLRYGVSIRAAESLLELRAVKIGLRI